MNNETITVLAREYAEEGIYVQIVEDDAAEFLRWLLRRYCLVEKVAVEAKYQEAKERYFNPDDEIEKTMYGGRMSMLEYLFPEFAKEEDNHDNQA